MTSILAQAAALSEPTFLGNLLIGVVLAAKWLYDHFEAKPRKREARESQKVLMSISSDVQRLEAYIIGPDGQNGLRGDVRELKARVIGIEERERDRLEARKA